MKNIQIFIDFDSTFIQTETLDEMVDVIYSNVHEKKIIGEKIHNITTLTMNGDIPFGQALDERLALLKIDSKVIHDVVSILQQKITPSFARNKDFFRKYHDNIFIVSGGFRECIIPIVTDFWIDASHVLANDFIFDNDGNAKGVDKKNPLSREGGKVDAVGALGLSGTKISIGDGYNDYKLKEAHAVDIFCAFVENIRREWVVKMADKTLENFDEFVEWIEKEN